MPEGLEQRVRTMYVAHILLSVLVWVATIGMTIAVFGNQKRSVSGALLIAIWVVSSGHITWRTWCYRLDIAEGVQTTTGTVVGVTKLGIRGAQLWHVQTPAGTLKLYNDTAADGKSRLQKRVQIAYTRRTKRLLRVL